MKRSGRPSMIFYCGMGIVLFFLLGYIFFPALKTVEKSILINGTLSFEHYKDLFFVKTLQGPLINSVLLGVFSVAVCGGVGIFLAFAVHFFKFPFCNAVDKLLLLPLVLPGIIIVFAFVQLYGESGMVTKAVQYFFSLDTPPFRLSGLPGILLIHAATQYVYFYVSVSIAIRHIDPSCVESAQSLGASPKKIFFSIILPFLKPAMVAAAAMTFISGAGSFTAPSIIGGSYKVLTTQILLSKANNYMSVAATQVTVLTGVSLMIFWVFRVYEARTRFTASVKAAPFTPVVFSNLLLKWGIIILTSLTALGILLPVAVIIVISFVPSSLWMVHYFPTEFTWQNYLDIFTGIRKIQPFFNSMGMSLAAAGFGLFIAVPSSFIIVKKKTRLKWLVEALVMMPWAIPCSAVAVNIINAFAEPSIFSFNAVLVGSAVLLPLGYLIRSLPIMVKLLNISFQNLNDHTIEASRSLGATGLHTFKKISIPLIRPGVIAGFLIVFIRSIGEYTISVFLYNASNKPMAIAMVNSVFEYNLGLAMAYGAILILLTFVLSFFISKIATGRIFS